jgi:membrane associated rhomboid family serine protease
MAVEGNDAAEAPSDDIEWRCYRHPDTEAGVRCRRCERPICPSCMVSAPVGFQCPECVKSGPAVRRIRPGQSLGGRPIVTTVLVAVNAAVFVLTFGNIDRALFDFGLYGPFVAAGDWWRLITSAFLHVSLIHVGFNCLLLWTLGSQLEPVLGRLRYGLVYAVALFGGGVGVMILDPRAVTAGASGAVFGLMGATFLEMRRRGIDPWQTGIGPLIVINLVLTFALGNISVGGHLGGLVAGGAAVAVLHAVDGRRPAPWVAPVLLMTMAVGLFAAGVVLAGQA